MGKEKHRQNEGKNLRDRDATWGAKGDKIVETEHGKENRKEYFYGYKGFALRAQARRDQVSLNAESELVTRVIPGWANDYDGHKLSKLVDKGDR